MPHTSFAITVTYKSGAEEETVCLCDVNLGIEKFVNAVNRTVKPPQKVNRNAKPPTKRRIIYKGIRGAGPPPLDPGTELDSDDLLLKLVNTSTHLVHIVEE